MKNRNVNTVVLVETSAHGAVLHTAASAAQRGLQVIVPIDGISADEPYAEQYTSWHLINAPGTRVKVILTRVNLITLENR